MRPLIVAAPSSGCGKTSVALGLMGALRQRGLSIAPFKVGPDYIDPGHHAAVCGRPSRNLDGWMCGPDSVRASFDKGCQGADVAVIEGVMGLFDGASGTTDEGSTAEIARWLNGRILLVVDARAQARSAAALLKGFTGFAADLDFAGVVFNRVGSNNHADLLREAVASVPGLPPVLGMLPRRDDLALPERHLGLVTATDGDWQDRYRRLTEWVADHLDVNTLSVAAGACQTETGSPAAAPPGSDRHTVRIGIARDQAFCFYYPENLELLEAAGAELVFFSPLQDRSLPDDLDGLYLGGGYPELHAERLAANRDLLGAIATAARRGLPIYAECGGLMTLAEGIDDRDLAGIFPGRARMLPQRKALGYREVILTRDTLLGPAGTTLRGHEFHYSTLELPASVTTAYRVVDRKGLERDPEGFCLNRVLGSYVHLHFGSNPAVAAHFVETCRTARAAGRTTA